MSLTRLQRVMLNGLLTESPITLSWSGVFKIKKSPVATKLRTNELVINFVESGGTSVPLVIARYYATHKRTMYFL